MKTTTLAILSMALFACSGQVVATDPCDRITEAGSVLADNADAAPDAAEVLELADARHVDAHSLSELDAGPDAPLDALAQGDASPQWLCTGHGPLCPQPYCSQAAMDAWLRACWSDGVVRPEPAITHPEIEAGPVDAGTAPDAAQCEVARPEENIWCICCNGHCSCEET